MTTAVFDSTKDWAKNAQSDRIPAEKLVAPREPPAGARASLTEQSNSSVSTFLLTDSEAEGGSVRLPQPLSRGNESIEDAQCIAGSQAAHTHSRVCFSDIAWKHLLSLLFSVLPPGLFTLKPCMKYAHAQAGHGREKESAAAY